MILTVTPNTGLDRIFFLDGLRRGRRNQAAAMVESMGGKGCDVALILAELGVETVATGIAAGEAGRRMEGMLRAGGVTPDFVWAGGETRINIVLIETESGAHTTLCAPTLQAGDEAREALLAWIGRWAPQAEAVVLAGSLPEAWEPGDYGELVRRARTAGCPVVVDANGEQLAAALAAGGLAAIKPNRHEVESLCGPLPSPEAVIAAAHELRARGAARVLASLGDEGAVLTSARGTWFAPALQVTAVNPAGAGDGMTASLALGEARRWDEEETLRHATATAAAIVTNPGTAEVRAAQVRQLLPQVTVTRQATT